MVQGLMSRIRQQVEVWHLLVALVVIVGTPVIGFAVAYGRSQAVQTRDIQDMVDVKVRLNAHDRDERVAADALERRLRHMDRNIVRIGVKVGAQLEPDE